MAPEIQIDDDLMDLLKQNAEPFVDTPSDVLRRLLEPGARSPGVDSAARSGKTTPSPNNGSRPARSKKRTRAPSSALLPEEAYELPLLRVLDEAGGRLPTREAISAVGHTLHEQLRPMDHDVVEGGRERWEMRVQFTRLRLVQAGHMKKGSPRGVWEISDQGSTRVRANGAS